MKAIMDGLTFEISMDYVLGVEIVDSVEDLVHDELQLSMGEFLLIPKQALEIVLEVLHDDEGRASIAIVPGG